MASLTFLGAAQTVTGSRHLLTTAAGKRILIDAGLFQGRKELRERNWAPWTGGRLDAVILTHAHIDHTGYLPRLCAQGLVGRVLCTTGTRELSALLLPDSGHLQEEDARYANRRGYSKHHPALPLYTARQAEAAVERLESFPYDLPADVVDGVQVTFHQAGHILGSAFLDLRADGKRILCSGARGRSGPPRWRDPDDPVQADALLLECTYGDRTHPPAPAADELADAIHQAVRRGGPLLIPAFAIGRTQEILFLWRRLEHEGRIPKLPLFVDSPMATDATPLYLKHPEDQSAEVRSLLARHVPPPPRPPAPPSPPPVRPRSRRLGQAARARWILRGHRGERHGDGWPHPFAPPGAPAAPGDDRAPGRVPGGRDARAQAPRGRHRAEAPRHYRAGPGKDRADVRLLGACGLDGGGALALARARSSRPRLPRPRRAS